jgi:3'-phosphoadenosine 5'-phosphosulfate sulfotransferase (PAPS reductase)/FAD synthetase
MAHKSSDVDPFEGAVPLKTDSVAIGQAEIIFPLRNWTDADVWDYLEENRVPYDKRRYQDRAELPDKWNNPDFIHACTRCIDPREKEGQVFCPKLRRNVPNVGAQVLRLQERPDYIEAAA